VEFLDLVQLLHYEAKLPGAPPDAVTGQSGRAADLVRWTAEAWNDLQREKDGRWKWRLSDWTFDSAADDADYTYGEITDVDAAAVITRFHAWEFDEEAPPLIYLVSDGKATENELPVLDWFDFRRLYIKGTHTSAPPTCISVKPNNNTLYLGPTPDDIYRITGNYWKSIQTLVADADTPEMPSDYHVLIVYRALQKYAYNIVGQEVLARANAEGMPLYDALINNQWYGRFRMRLPPAIA